MPNERRQFTRVLFPIHAAIECQGAIVSGNVSDLSLRGFFVATEERVPMDEEVNVTLRMQGTNPPIVLRFAALVVRVIPSGIGLKICEADLQSFTHLRNVVAMQSDDPDHILDEFLPES